MLERRDLLKGLALLAGLGAGGGLAGCGGEASGGGSDGEAGADPGRATQAVAVSAVARSSADPAALTSAAASVSAFAADLYQRISAAAPGNVACSPYSVAVALAMTRVGAAGRTARELDAVLHAPDLAELAAGMNALSLHLAGLAGPRRNATGGKAQIALDTANALWGQRGIRWQQPFLDTLGRDYGAGVRLADYERAATTARVAINAWTAQRTHGRIPHLVPTGVLDTGTRLVLVNAVYLKAPWDQPFEKVATTPAPFTRADGSVVRVPMMSGSLAGARYVTGPGWRAVEVPYAGRELAMTVLVPDPGRLASVAGALHGDALHGLLTGGRPAEVRLRLPRWTFRTQVSLTAALTALGMPSAFGDAADFSRMTTQERLAIRAVLHEAFVAVDEAGTEAAAATAVALGTSAQGFGGPAVELVADRPFLFVIHDTRTATPLFIGRVTDPSAG
ncbi:MAG: serpin family protein [Frankia sp.]